jgi:hypothetical protein
VVGGGWWVVGGGCWVLGVGWWVLGGGWWVLGGGCWVVGGGWWVVGVGTQSGREPALHPLDSPCEVIVRRQPRLAPQVVRGEQAHGTVV